MQNLCQPCRRLIASGCLPDRAGQPTQIMLHMGLGRLRDLPGADAAESAWGAGAAPGDECDASIVPVVTGHVDPEILDRLATALLHGTTTHPGPAQPGPGEPGPAQPGPGQSAPVSLAPPTPAPVSLAPPTPAPVSLAPPTPAPVSPVPSGRTRRRSVRRTRRLRVSGSGPRPT